MQCVIYLLHCKIDNNKKLGGLFSDNLSSFALLITVHLHCFAFLLTATLSGETKYYPRCTSAEQS